MTNKPGTTSEGAGQTTGPAAPLSDDQWAAAIDAAEQNERPLHAELLRVARRFQERGDPVGIGIGTSLLMLSAAGQVAKTRYEVHAMGARALSGLAGAVFDARLDDELFD
ncbi:MAG TPA: hypothetical protein VF989_00920 [Polyangiaceae bacterium]|jgi:hypothetical protein